MGGIFPNSVCEDYYTENIAVTHGWIGALSPLTVCTQAYDINIKAHYSRIMRVVDWIIKLRKTDTFVNYNERYSGWFSRSMILLFAPLLLVISILGISVIIWWVVLFWNDLIHNVTFISIILTSILSLIVTMSIVNYDNAKINGIINSLLFPFFMVLYSFSFISYICKHWFNTMILSKYSNFQQGTQKKFFTKSLSLAFKKILPDVIMFMCFSIPTCCFNIFCTNLMIHNTSLLYVYILVNMILGSLSLSFLSTIILYLFSFVKVFDYNPNKFIYYKNKYVSFDRIKNKFYAENKKTKRLC
jgi:hypothetical protein